MVLEWTPEEASLLLSLLQHQSTSQAKHGRLRSTRHFPASVYWVPIGPGDRRLCMRLVLVSFTLIYRRHSTINLSLFNTSEESLRD